MKIGIIVAMEKELVQLRTIIEHAIDEQHNGKAFILGRIGENEVIVQQCGIGKVNSTIGAVEMINGYHPDLVISTGVAGGADLRLNVTEAVVSTTCAYHDVYCGSECQMGQVLGMPATFASPVELVAKAQSLSCGTRVHAGILHHFPHAMAVDMESCSIAQTCHKYGVPFISFRIISDIPLKDEKAAQYFDFWARIAEGSFAVTKAFLEVI